MKSFALIFFAVLASQTAFAFIFTCQVENKMEMVNIIKKYDYTTEPGKLPGQGLYILELHNVGEPFPHTASEGTGFQDGELIQFSSEIMPLTATLNTKSMSGILLIDHQSLPFKDCMQIQ